MVSLEKRQRADAEISREHYKEEYAGHRNHMHIQREGEKETKKK